MPQTNAQKRALALGTSGGDDVYPQLSAASLRSPRKGEIRPLSVTTSSVLHHVPDGNASGGGTPDWRNRIIDCKAEGGIVYIAFGNTDDVALTVDEAALAVQTAAVSHNDFSATRITGHASDNECWTILDGETRAIPVGDALCFAIKGSTACTLRTHVSES